MNKKSGLAILVIALAGVLFYALYSGTQSEKSPAVSDRSASFESVSSPASTKQTSLEEPPSPRESADIASATTVASPTVTPVNPAAPPLEPEIRAALGKLLNTSSEGLVEKTRNGATSVDLQGRFQTAPVATINERGEARIVDYSSVPKEPPE